MSALNKKDLHTPFSGGALGKVYGHIEKMWYAQTAAADATGAALLGQNPWPNGQGKIQSLTFFSTVAAASGESCSVDVLRTPSGGSPASILSAPLVFDSTYAAMTQIPLPLAAITMINPGDLITTTLDYTAGGTPAMTSVRVQCEVA